MCIKVYHYPPCLHPFVLLDKMSGIQLKYHKGKITLHLIFSTKRQDLGVINTS
jgi:hypothetical protein